MNRPLAVPDKQSTHAASLRSSNRPPSWRQMLAAPLAYRSLSVETVAFARFYRGFLRHALERASAVCPVADTFAPCAYAPDSGLDGIVVLAGWPSSKAPSISRAAARDLPFSFIVIVEVGLTDGAAVPPISFRPHSHPRRILLRQSIAA